MTDPEARLTAALDEADGIEHAYVTEADDSTCTACGVSGSYGHTNEYRTRSIFAADPTLAADLALAADINRISRWGMDGWVIECDSQDTAYRVTVTGYDPKRSRLHPTLHEAIEEALSDE